VYDGASPVAPLTRQLSSLPHRLRQGSLHVSLQGSRQRRLSGESRLDPPRGVLPFSRRK
jgi:hypothetical protein